MAMLAPAAGAAPAPSRPRMADIGKPEREIDVQPLESPLPGELPVEPPAPAPREPAPRPAPVPA
jgi:hypothetical protein